MDYKLYYWEAPFRGNFPRLLLWDSGAEFRERPPTDIYTYRRLKIQYPGMAPPYLYHVSSKKYLAQMPAIMMFLAADLGYLPKDKFSRHLCGKLILDCNDVLIEMTNYNGNKMWEEDEWKDFRRDRLSTWMKIFEFTGKDHGLEKNKGFMLGSSATAADFAVVALFGTLIHCMPEFKEDLESNAPRVLGLCERIEKRPGIKEALKNQRAEYGNIYCGGQIENSIRSFL